MSKETEIQQKVFEKIRAGEVSMRPKIYFIARVALLTLLAIVALTLAIFVLSFAFFSIHESGEQFLLGFGRHGLLAFITLFPWVPLLITVALIFFLDYLLRYFKFGYRVSALEIFLFALAVVVIAGIAINFTPLHATLLNLTPAGEVLVAQRTLAVQRPAPSLDAAGGVRALSAATDAAIDELAQWLQQVESL